MSAQRPATPAESPAPARRLKVAHLHSSLGVYGAERWTLALLAHLDADAVAATVVSIGTKPGADLFYQLLHEQGRSAHHLRIGGRLSGRAVLELRRFLVREGVDVLHTHGFKADVLGYVATVGTRVRLVSTLHGWSADEGRRIQAYEALSRVFLRRFDRVFPVSPALLQQAEEQGFDRRRLHLVLNAVDLDGLEFAFTPRRAEEPFTILFAGRLCRPKGVFDLVQAVARARFTGPMRLVVVGDGEDRAALAQLAGRLGIGSVVTFAGAVPSIVPHLAVSHALVLPSYSEGIPRVVMEAFAVGVPVVGTNISGIRELVRHEHTGLLVPVGAPEALARACERLCAAPELGQRMAREARRVVVERHSARRMAEDLQREYRELCSTD